MLLVSMGVSIDGFINDRAGSIDWSGPDDELFDFHLARVRELGGCLMGRRLYESMLVWETDPSLRSSPSMEAFADAWVALPKVVFSRTLNRPQGTSRLAVGSVADEVARMLASTDRDVEIGGADLAGQAFDAGLVDELRLFRYPIVLGGGTPLLPPVVRPRRFQLLETRVFPAGVAYERYRAAPAEAAPFS